MVETGLRFHLTPEGHRGYNPTMISKQERNIVAELLRCCGKALRRFCGFPLLVQALAALELGDDVHLLAIGKDAGRMCEAALKVLNDELSDGFVLTKYGHYLCDDARICHLEAGHPVPDANSLSNSALIVEWLSRLGNESELIVLLSGGGSALFEMLKDGQDQAGLTALNKGLLLGSHGIATINRERARVSRLKAGGALDFFKGRRLRVFALSDVESDDPAVIASGPFTPVRQEGRVEYRIVGNNLSFRNLLVSELASREWDVVNDPGFISGIPAHFVSIVAEKLKIVTGREMIMVWGGEIPISVSGNGKGGRCTHLALSVAPLLASRPGAVFIALATDGSDFLSGSAGAWVDSRTTSRLGARNMDVEKILAQSDSYSALKDLNQVLAAVEYQVNVNDVFLLYLPANLNLPVS